MKKEKLKIRALITIFAAVFIMGSFCFADEIRDTASITAGKTQGIQTVEYDDGDIYIGELDETGRKSGKGILIWADGSHYAGEWEADEMNGEGIYYYSMSQTPRLEGVFKNNKADGKCIFYTSPDISFITEWNMGDCLEIQPNN